MTTWIPEKSLAFNVARQAEMARIRTGFRHTDLRSDLPLDVYIPAAEHDCDVLGVAIEALKRNLAHPVEVIWVVTALGSKAARIAEEHGCRVVDEDTVLPIVRTDIEYRVGSDDRSGWLFQQLLKLHADAVSSQDTVLVLDADTVLVRPQTFTSGGRPVLFHSPEYHEPYFRVYRAVTGLEPATRLSCTTHHMLMRRKGLAALRALMEENRLVPWWRAVLDTCDYDSVSGFSEYELYGNHELTCNRGRLRRRWWSNAALPRSELAGLEVLQRRHGDDVRAVSFHHYL